MAVSAMVGMSSQLHAAELRWHRPQREAHPVELDMILKVDCCSLPSLNWCIECNYLRFHLSYEIQHVKNGFKSCVDGIRHQHSQLSFLSFRHPLQQLWKAENL